MARRAPAAADEAVDRRLHRGARRCAQGQGLRRGRPHPRRARRDGHRAQGRQGPHDRRTGHDVGGEAVSTRTPHPARLPRPPSPARGEGSARSNTVDVVSAAPVSSTPVPISNVDRSVLTSVEGAEPSPLAGEGGAARGAAPGEGPLPKKRSTRSVSEPVAFARQLRKTPTEAEQVLWQMLRTGPFRAGEVSPPGSNRSLRCGFPVLLCASADRGRWPRTRREA